MRSSRSTRDAWEALVAAGPPTWVLGHCRLVAGLARRLGELAKGQGHEVDLRLCTCGGLLHDIGRAKTQDVRHAHLGADLVRGLGFDEPLARVVETHTGAGIDPDEARRLSLPDRDYLPRSLEEKIVAHADNLCSGEARVELDWVTNKYESRGLVAAAARIRRLHDEVADLVGGDPEQVVAAPLEITSAS